MGIVFGLGIGEGAHLNQYGDIVGELGEAVAGARGRQSGMLPVGVAGFPANMIALGILDRRPGEGHIAELEVLGGRQAFAGINDHAARGFIGGRGGGLALGEGDGFGG